MTDRSAVVWSSCVFAALSLAACDDAIVGTWRLQDRDWTMTMSLESGGTGEYDASNPALGRGDLRWEDHGSVNGYYLDFECSSGCEDPTWRWTCSFRDDGAKLACSMPWPFDDETYVFEDD